MKKIYEQIVSVLDGVGAQVYRIGDPLATLPGIIVGVPAIEWNGPNTHHPTDAVWLVAVVVAAGDSAATDLWELVPKVGALLDTIAACSVTRADPGIWQDGTVSLPCYEIEMGVDL